MLVPSKVIMGRQVNRLCLVSHLSFYVCQVFILEPAVLVGVGFPLDPEEKTYGILVYNPDFMFVKKTKYSWISVTYYKNVAK